MTRKRPDNPGMHTTLRDPGFPSRVAHRVKMTKKHDDQRKRERAQLEAEMAAYQEAPKTVLIKGHPPRVDEQRAKRVAKAERRLGLKEGIYVLRGAHRPCVQIRVKFYPRTRWFVEDVNIADGMPIPATGVS